MGKNSKEGLGRALVKDRFNKNRNKRKVENNTMLHTTEINDGYDWGRLNLQSVTAESSLQEFLSTAELAAKEFTAEKLNIRYVKSTPSTVPTTGTTDVVPNETLTVPRRPPWKPGITAEEQSEREKESFLDWRRRLVELQEIHGAAVTPYERNLELWKQLWRTLERSDLVLLLMDARNPLLFRCSDLENYAKEQNCKCVLLLNKADLIGEFERKAWAEYFNKEGIYIIFFSAAAQAEKLKQSLNKTDFSDKISEGDESDLNANREENAENLSDDETQAPEKSEENDPQEIVQIRQQINELDKKVSTTADRLNKIQDLLDIVLSDIQEGTDTNLDELYCNMNDHNTSLENQEKYENIHVAHVENLENNVVDGINNLTEIMDRDMLVEYLRNEKSKLKLKNPPRITFGLIGYPNVGKSSTVNVLMQTKKVSVSAMPGHTRHIQSLVLDDDIQLLDCPGLVLPAYAVTPDLLLTAVLPIDQMRAHDTAISRLCELIGRRVIETKYGLLLPDTGDDRITQKELLTAHAYNRGFMTASGQPDVSRSARFLLKDAASGRLQWSVMPPGVARLQHELEPRLDTKRKPTPQEARMVEGWTTKSSEIDKTFFTTNKNVAHLKGKPVAGLSPSGSVIIPEGEIPSKPWKLENKHSNKKKREKLRITYRHLDEH